MQSAVNIRALSQKQRKPLPIRGSIGIIELAVSAAFLPLGLLQSGLIIKLKDRFQTALHERIGLQWKKDV